MTCLKMASHVLCILLVFPLVFANDDIKNEGIIEHLNNGMKFAKDILGSESVALKVADFVVRAFQTVNKPSSSKRRPSSPETYVDDSDEGEQQTFENKQPSYNLYEVPTTSPWDSLVRLMGLQPKQISAVAVNALIFVAQMITTFLAGPKRPRKPYRSDDPTAWILNKNSEKLQALIATAKNDSLPKLIEDLIDQHDNAEETSCIKLFVCKLTPYVSKMQKAVFGQENETKRNDFGKKVRGAAIMYRHLPSEDEIKNRGDLCEKQYKDCDLNE